MKYGYEMYHHIYKCKVCNNQCKYCNDQFQCTRCEENEKDNNLGTIPYKEESKRLRKSIG